MIYAELAPLVLAAVLVLMIPGLLVSWSAGARGWVLAGSAGPMSVSIISVTAILTGFAGLPWNIMVVLAASAALATVLFILRRLPFAFLHKHSAQLPDDGGGRGARLARNSLPPAPAAGAERGHHTWVGILVAWFAVVVVFLVLFWRLGQIFGATENISQTFDNVFHLNAVRYIIDTGNASSLRLSGFTSSTGVGGFYPAAWHDIASLTQQLTGSTVPAAVNASNVAIAALLWPLSCLLLATALFGRRRLVVVSAAALAAGFSSFPYLMLDFGVLYPNLLSISLLPASIGLIALAVRSARGLMPPTVSVWILSLASLPGLALAHPSTLMAFLAWTYPVVIVAAIAVFQRWRSRFGKPRAAGVVLLGLAAYTCVFLVAWKMIRPNDEQSTWQPVQGLAQAFGQALTSAPQDRPIPWLIFSLTLAGIWAILRQHRHLWILAMLGISCIMFTIVSGYPFGPVRTWFGGVWYNDPFRLAALLPVAALPVAVLGVVWLSNLVHGLVSSRLENGWAPALGTWTTGPRATFASAGVSILVFAAILGLSQGSAVTAAVASAAGSYSMTPASELVDTDEMILLRRVAKEIPPDNIVVSSPWTGASMVYAIADRKSLTPHIFSEFGADTSAILNRLNRAGEDPAICEIVRRLKTYYVLDFGSREILGHIHVMPGLVGMATDPDFTLVDSQGDAKLYKVTACGEQAPGT